jgi:hypothetical protein
MYGKKHGYCNKKDDYMGWKIKGDNDNAYENLIFSLLHNFILLDSDLRLGEKADSDHRQRQGLLSQKCPWLMAMMGVLAFGAPPWQVPGIFVQQKITENVFYNL